MFFVYILKSLKDHRFYIGQTNNLEDRVRRHNEGRVVATKGRRPLILVRSEEFESRSEAVRRERELKSFKGNSRFRELVDAESKG
jgi:putative endonuclease